MKKISIILMFLLLLSFLVVGFTACNDEKVIDNDNDAIDNPSDEPVDTRPLLTLVTNIEEAGAVFGEGRFDYNEDLFIRATSNSGYYFLGWYYGNDLLSTSAEYNCKMWDKDVTLEAKFTALPENYDTTNGSLSSEQMLNSKFDLYIKTGMPNYGKISVDDGDNKDEHRSSKKPGNSIKVLALTTSSKRFLGWFDEADNLIMANGVFDFVMPTFDYTLTAKWECTCTEYELDEVSGKYLCKECGGDHLVKIVGDFMILVADNANTLVKYSGTSDKIVVPNNITKIDANVFKDCYNLSSITIPCDISKIESSAFENCVNLTNVYITDIAKWCGISFANHFANPLYYAQNLYLNEEKVTELAIPDNATTIGDYAFYGYTDLSKVTIPNSVTSIGKSAFWGCANLTNVTIPNSVTNIGDSVFSGCSSLESLTVPFIGHDTNSSEDYYDPLGYLFGETNYEGGVATEQYYAHYNYWSTIYYIPSALKAVTVLGGEIPRGSFENCENITTVILGNDVTKISQEAFYDCTNLTSITIPSSVTSIKATAFRGCTKLTSAIFENTTGWQYFYEYTSTTGILSASDLADTATAAEYLTSTYDNYDWYRN